MKPETAAGIQPVLPFEAKGVFFVPFIYWIITIFIVAIVHEFAHGIIARTHKIPLKSTGFAFFCIFIPIIPAAFVEPDEETLRLRKKKEQLSVLAAGSFANILVGLFSLVILLTAMVPLTNAAFQNQGIEITSISDNSPASIAGMQEGEEIRFIAGNKVDTTDQFMEELTVLKSGEEIKIKTEKEVYNLVLSEKDGTPFVGVGLAQKKIAKEAFVAKYGSFTPKVIETASTLFFFLFLLNLGIGLFNLLPIIPLDGGRMLAVLVDHKKKGKILFRYVSMFFLLLIIVNLVAGFI